jgi:hypothetical protein
MKSIINKKTIWILLGSIIIIIFVVIVLLRLGGVFLFNRENRIIKLSVCCSGQFKYIESSRLSYMDKKKIDEYSYILDKFYDLPYEKQQKAKELGDGLRLHIIKTILDYGIPTTVSPVAEFYVDLDDFVSKSKATVKVLNENSFDGACSKQIGYIFIVDINKRLVDKLENYEHRSCE